MSIRSKAMLFMPMLLSGMMEGAGMSVTEKGRHSTPPTRMPRRGFGMEVRSFGEAMQSHRMRVKSAKRKRANKNH